MSSNDRHAASSLSESQGVVATKVECTAQTEADQRTYVVMFQTVAPSATEVGEPKMEVSAVIVSGEACFLITTTMVGAHR